MVRVVTEGVGAASEPRISVEAHGRSIGRLDRPTGARYTARDFKLTPQFPTRIPVLTQFQRIVSGKAKALSSSSVHVGGTDTIARAFSMISQPL